MARTARYTESVSAMVEGEQKAFLLGSAIVEEVSEGDVLRALLEGGIAGARGVLTETEYEERMTRGRNELDRRERARQT